jgi:hypothetical protein
MRASVSSILRALPHYVRRTVARLHTPARHGQGGVCVFVDAGEPSRSSRVVVLLVRL